MVGTTTSVRQLCDNVASTLSNFATERQPKTNVFTTSCASWDETKLVFSFPASEFTIPGYRLFRKDRSQHGESLTFYVNQGIPCKIIDNFSFPNSIEAFPLEINFVVHQSSTAKCLHCLKNFKTQSAL